MVPPAVRGRGEFEADLMSVLRSHGTPLSAREIADALPYPQPSLPPVFTALGRLERKGEVTRSSGTDGGVRFTAVHDEAQHASQAMIDALVDTRDRNAVLLHFAGELSDQDRELLARALRRSTRSRGSRPS